MRRAKMKHWFSKFVILLAFLLFIATTAAATTAVASTTVDATVVGGRVSATNNVSYIPVGMTIGAASDLDISKMTAGIAPVGAYNMTLQDQEFLNAHNKVRIHTGLAPLKWDARVATFARLYALNRSADCALKHSTGPFGENLFWGGGDTWTPAEAVKDWISEHKFYSKKYNSCVPGRMCGHYTQIIWKDTQRVGCAKVRCGQGDTYMVCSYDPPGNYGTLRPLLRHNPAMYNTIERLNKIKAIVVR